MYKVATEEEINELVHQQMKVLAEDIKEHINLRITAPNQKVPASDVFKIIDERVANTDTFFYGVEDC